MSTQSTKTSQRLVFGVHEDIFFIECHVPRVTFTAGVEEGTAGGKNSKGTKCDKLDIITTFTLT